MFCILVGMFVCSSIWRAIKPCDDVPDHVLYSGWYVLCVVVYGGLSSPVMMCLIMFCILVGMFVCSGIWRAIKPCDVSDHVLYSGWYVLCVVVCGGLSSPVMG